MASTHPLKYIQLKQKKDLGGRVQQRVKRGEEEKHSEKGSCLLCRYPFLLTRVSSNLESTFSSWYEEKVLRNEDFLYKHKFALQRITSTLIFGVYSGVSFFSK